MERGSNMDNKELEKLAREQEKRILETRLKEAKESIQMEANRDFPKFGYIIEKSLEASQLQAIINHIERNPR